MRNQRGFSLVELMVGITVGLFVVLGALGATTGLLRGDVVAAARADQELRALALFMERELARAGYHGRADEELDKPLAAYDNPFARLDVTTEGCLLFSYDRNGNGVLDTDATSEERQAFALANGIVYRRASGTSYGCDPEAPDSVWEALTDPQTAQVQTLQFNLTVSETPVAGSTRALLSRSLGYSVVAAPARGPVRTLENVFKLPNDVLGPQEAAKGNT
jgi:prepilin-type N-terminal cleavage/methylation domain-containing protein